MTPAEQITQAAARACEAVGSRLHVAGGWAHRGHGITPVTWKAVLWHDTITGPTWSREQLTGLLRDGRADLPGPIANVQLERDGDAVLIAAGRAYHAGAGRDTIGAGIQSGNLHTCGLEVANLGPDEPWTAKQYRWAVVFTAELCGLAIGHYEWTTRKGDPWTVDMDQARRDVAAYLEEDDMAGHDKVLAQIADNTARQLRLSQALVASQVAAHRAKVGLGPSPDSDELWARRIAGGSDDLAEAKRRLNEVASNLES